MPEPCRRHPRIVGFGVACIDYIVAAPYAEPGGRSDAGEFVIQGGGLTGTSTVTAARLGASTALISRIGDDETGDKIVADLRGEGVDVSGIIRVPGGTSLVSVVVVDSATAERTIYSRLDKDIDCPTELIDFERVRSADVVLLDPHWKEGALLAAAEAKSAGVPLVCDANNPVCHSDLLAMCDYPILSRSSALRLAESGDTSEVLRAVRSLGPRTAVITCGSDGAYYCEGGSEGHVSAFRVDAVDTTGAGDAFHGAFAFGLAQGWGIRNVVVFASAVAAIKCTKLGGRAGLPGLDEVLCFIASQGCSQPQDR